MVILMDVQRFGGILGSGYVWEDMGDSLMDGAVNNGRVTGESDVGELAGRIDTDDDFCFIAGTKVVTPNGYKNIEDIQIGDIVYSMNLETMQMEEKAVTRLKITENVIKLTYLVYTEENHIESTPDHKYYVKDKGWTDACELEIGDILINEKGNEKAITDIQIKEYEEPITVYNFEVEDNQNYFVGEDKILVYTIPRNVKEKITREKNFWGRRCKMTNFERAD